MPKFRKINDTIPRKRPDREDGRTKGWKDGQKDGQKDGRTDRRTERPCFIGPYRLLPGVQEKANLLL